MASLESYKIERAESLAYQELRKELCTKFLQDGNCLKLLHGLSDAMDSLISNLKVLKEHHKEITVIATGGYGRRELFPYSDIDLLFLTDLDADRARPIIEAVLYPLWNLNLQLGHAVHDVDSALHAQAKDLSLATALLDMRFIAGNEKLFKGLQHDLKRPKSEQQEQSFIEAKLAERDKRHKRFGDSRYLLEPNIKESKGGLRDLHTLEWLVKYVYGTSNVRDLVKEHLLTGEEAGVFEKARKFLWNMRAHMHIMADKAEERLTFDMQQKLAGVMGYGTAEPHHAVERMMKRYFTNARIIGSLTRILCSILEDQHKRKPKLSLASLITSHLKLHGFIMEGERLSVKSEEEFEKNPIRMLELFFVASIERLDIHPRALQWVARNLNQIDRTFQYSPDACQLFMRILLDSPELEVTLRRMNDVGLLGRFIPAFRRVVGQTQFNMYHIYTVDEHTIVALGILRQLELGKLRTVLPGVTQVAQQITKRHVLYLALLCHDIAKGRGGDHSEIGEDIGRKLALRFGFSKGDAECVAWLVRYHLLMSSTAFKRDLSDPKTVHDFVGMVKTSSLLRLLAVLTVVDIRAVGPAVWNNWKAGLLKELYTKSEIYIRTGQLHRDNGITEQLTATLQKALTNKSEEEIQQYIAVNEIPYLATIPHALQAEIFKMVESFNEGSEIFKVYMQHDEIAELSDIVICTRDRTGLFADLCAALSLANANIISAKIFTRKDGIAVDIFQIQGFDRKAFDAPEKQSRLENRLRQVLNHEINISAELKQFKKAIPSRKDALKKSSEVYIENSASNVASVIEITSTDRTGLLYDIAKEISNLGLSIASAHISTYGTQAADVFYVKDAFGHKIEHPQKIKHITESLKQSLHEK